MSAHTLVRFRQIEVQLREVAEKTLTDPAATLVEKREARRTLHETLLEAQRRQRVKKAKDALGPQPKRQDFASDEEYAQARDAYRLGLDRLSCEEILDSPAPLGKRNLARRTLDAIERQERQRGMVPAPRKPERSDPKGRYVETKPATDDINPDVRRFFDGELETKTTVEAQPEAEKPRPAPQAVKLYCEHHQVSLELCGCSEICPIHLLERRLCRCFKEKK